MGALKQGPETLDALIAHRTILMNSSKERFKPQNEQERPPLDEEKESKQLGEEAGLIVGDRQAIAALTNTKLLLEALTYKIQGRSRGKD